MTSGIFGILGVDMPPQANGSVPGQIHAGGEPPWGAQPPMQMTWQNSSKGDSFVGYYCDTEEKDEREDTCWKTVSSKNHHHPHHPCHFHERGHVKQGHSHNSFFALREEDDDHSEAHLPELIQNDLSDATLVQATGTKKVRMGRWARLSQREVKKTLRKEKKGRSVEKVRNEEEEKEERELLELASLCFADEKDAGEAEEMIGIPCLCPCDTEVFEPRSRRSGWRRLDCVIDSGCGKSVGPVGMSNDPVVLSAGSKANKVYQVANGHFVRNQGEQLVKGYSEDGEDAAVLFQVANVTRPLIAVSELSDQGCNVVFGKYGGLIYNKMIGARKRFVRRGGIYEFSLWVQEEPPTEAPELAKGFRRQGP